VEASIYVYPWDIVEMGVEQFLDELQGLNLNGLEVAVSYHAGKFLRPRGRRGSGRPYKTSTATATPQSSSHRGRAPSRDTTGCPP